MNTPANPAVTSREAGISPSSSRLRALIRCSCPQLQARAPACRRSRSERSWLLKQRAAAIGGHKRSGNPGDVERLVQVHPGRQVVRQPAIDRHDALLVGADEVQLAGGQIAAAADQEQHDQRRRSARHSLACRRRRRAAGPARPTLGARERGGLGRGARTGGRAPPPPPLRTAWSPGAEVLDRRSPARRPENAEAQRRRRWARRRPPSSRWSVLPSPPDLLDAEQHDRDVVPPAGLVGLVDQRVAPPRRAICVGREDLRTRLLGDHRGEAVAAEQQDVPGAHRIGPRVDLDLGLGAQRARDDRPLRMLGRLGLGQLSLADQLVDQRVVLGEALQLAVAEQVGAAVADVGDGQLGRRRDRRPSASSPSRPARARPASGHRSGGWPPGRAPRAAPPGCPSPGSPCSNASIAICDATSPAWAPPMPSATTNTGGARVRAVLVLAPLAAGVGPADGFRCSQHRRHLQVGELGVADPDPITRMKRLRPVERLVVQICAVRRSQVLDHQDVTLARDAGVAGGRERILQLDLYVPPAESSALAEVVGDVRTGARGLAPPAASAHPVAAAIGQPVGGRVHARGVGRRCAGRSPRPRRPRRRSRSALHATQIRNRYRTARKPNLSATETGWSMGRLATPART